MKLVYAISLTWEKQFTFVERVLQRPDKKLILFGAGQMLIDYLRVFGEEYPPCFAVDNNEKRWGSQVQGVPVKSPDAILDVPAEERNVVVCCMYYDSIDAQLDEMGVEYDEFIDRYFV
jgi:FlaA1/EpsC-like NDP-sugar epimerase